MGEEDMAEEEEEERGVTNGVGSEGAMFCNIKKK